MKRLNILLPLIIITIFYVSCSGASNTSEIDNALAYDGDFHQEIIKPQVEAWQKVAKIMYPRVSDDTEADWAAHVADSIGNAILAEPSLSNGEQLARLYNMENVIAYGMTYFSAIISSYSNPDASQEALATVTTSFNEFDSLRVVGFDSPKHQIDYQLSTYRNFGLFMELGSQYADGEPQFVTNNLNMQQRNAALCQLFLTHLKNETQAYRYSEIVNNTTYFMTFCPLCFWLAGNEFQELHQNEYLVIGEWFDKKLLIINNCNDETELSSLPEITLEKYSTELKKATDYKVQLIQLLYKGIMSIPVEE